MGYYPEHKYDLDSLFRQADNGDTEAMMTAAMLMAAEGVPELHSTKYLSYIKKLAEQGNSAGYKQVASSRVRSLCFNYFTLSNPTLLFQKAA